MFPVHSTSCILRNWNDHPKHLEPPGSREVNIALRAALLKSIHERQADPAAS